MTLEGGFVAELEKRMKYFELFHDFVAKTTIDKFERLVEKATPEQQGKLAIAIPAALDRLIVIRAIDAIGGTDKFREFYETVYSNPDVSQIEKKRKMVEIGRNKIDELKAVLTLAAEQLYSGQVPDTIA
jgi:hypothetical protein